MKLHTPCGAAEPEGLIRHVIAGYRQISASREIEGVLVPLESPIAGRKGAEQDVALTLIGEAHALEAELADRRPQPAASALAGSAGGDADRSGQHSSPHRTR